MHKISVILPLYNVAPYLSRCLESIINNTYKDLEIICVNDGSTDNSLEIIREFAQKDQRFQIVDQKNGGVSAARNSGLRKATGAYIAFIDPDDYIHPDYFAVLVKGLLDHQADIAVCSFEKVYDGHIRSDTIGDFAAGANYQTLCAHQFPLPYVLRSFTWARLYRKAVLQNCCFNENMKVCEDSLFQISVFSTAPEIKVIATPLPLYYYYQREASAKNHAVHEKIQAYEQIMLSGQSCRYAKGRNLHAYLALRTVAAAYLMKHSQNLSAMQIKDIKKKMRTAYGMFTDLPLRYRVVFGITAYLPCVYYAKVQVKSLLGRIRSARPG